MAKGRTSSTRNEILNILKLHGSQTVSELSEKLQITEMAVRRHLNTLERDHFVQTQLIRQAMGRPANIYSLTEESDHLFPRVYSDFALEFLQDIKELEGQEKVNRLFARREERMVESYKKQIQGETLEEKVQQLAQIQNQKGYMVEVEKDPETGDFLFKENNCPISQVAKEYNQACECELSLFKTVLGTDVTQIRKMSQGGDKCVYVIKANSTK